MELGLVVTVQVTAGRKLKENKPHTCEHSHLLLLALQVTPCHVIALVRCFLVLNLQMR